MSERTAVQNPLLLYAQGADWDCVRPDDALALRGGDTGLYFDPVLETQLLRLNPGIVDSGRAAEIVRQLKLLHSTIEGNRDALAWLRGEHSVFVPDENRERNVRLLDFDDPDRNARRRLAGELPRLWDVIYRMSAEEFRVEEIR